MILVLEEAVDHEVQIIVVSIFEIYLYVWTVNSKTSTSTDGVPLPEDSVFFLAFLALAFLFLDLHFRGFLLL